MSDDKITVELKEREILGKGLVGLRADGQVPAVIHDHGKPSLHVMGDHIKIAKAYATAGKHHPVQLKIGGKQRLALIKDVDFEPTKHQMRHVVFQSIKQNEETEAEIPVVFKDVEIPAERANLLVLKQLDSVQVKALPKDLPNELIVDPSTLAEVGDHLTVADLTPPAGVTITAPPETSIAAVEMPKDQLAEADAAKKDLEEDAGAKPAEEEAVQTPGAQTETKEEPEKEAGEES